MAYGVTAQGFRGKSFQTILEEISTQLEDELGIDLSSQPDTVLDTLTNIVALAATENWQIGSALQPIFNINHTYGKHLDDVVGWVGMKRKKGARSAGNMYITTEREFFIPVGSTFTDATNNKFTNTEVMDITRSNTVDIFIEINTANLTVNDLITFVINDSNYTTAYQDFTSLKTALTQALALEEDLTVEVADSGDGVVLNVRLTAQDDKKPFKLSFSNNLQLKEITCFGIIRYEQEGDFTFAPKTITKGPSYGGVLKYENRYQVSGGRLLETDDELRIRHALTRSSSGSSTIPAIQASVLDVSGVTSCQVLENDTETYDQLLDLPPKSIRVVVKGGEDDPIATALINNTPAGIRQQGDISILATDNLGNVKEQKFSRPKLVYLALDVDVFLKPNESIDLKDLAFIQEICEQYLRELQLGESVYSKRIEGRIITQMDKLADVQVKMSRRDRLEEPVPPRTADVIYIAPLEEVSESNNIDVSHNG